MLVINFMLKYSLFFYHIRAANFFYYLSEQDISAKCKFLYIIPCSSHLTLLSLFILILLVFDANPSPPSQKVSCKSRSYLV